MPTAFTRSMQSRAQMLGSGDSYVTLSGTTAQAGTASLATAVGAHIVCQAIPDTGPTDDIDFNLYGAHSDDNLYDTVPLRTTRMDTAGGDGTSSYQLSFLLEGRMPELIKAEAVQTGSTDSHDVRIYITTWQYSGA